MNVSDIHVVHRTVVLELSVVPTAAFIALTSIAVAIVDPAVETYMRTPVAFIESVSAMVPAPIAWGPEETGLRSHDPRARHPVIIAVAVSPVAGCPEITLGGHGRLLIHRQRRRAKRNGYSNLRERCRGDGQHYEREQQRTNGGDDTHMIPLCRSSLACPVTLYCCGLRGWRGTIPDETYCTLRLANGSGMTFSLWES